MRKRTYTGMMALITLAATCGATGAAQTADGHITYHAVLCGISDYPGTSADLNYCDDDARDLRDALLASEGWEGAHISTQIDTGATKEQIHAAIQDMALAADADDVCIIAFSGHGTTGNDLYPYDESDGYDEYLVPYNGIVLDPYYFDYFLDSANCIRDDELGDWVAQLPTEKVVLLLDACYSGGQIKTLAGRVKGIGSIVPASGDGLAADLQPQIKALDLDANGFGVALTACDDDELAQESGLLGNGVFTYYLVQGIENRRADADADGLVSAEELYAYTAPLAATWNPNQHAQLYDAYPDELPIMEEEPAAHHFAWAPIHSPQYAHFPIPVTIVVKDDTGVTVTDFAETAALSAHVQDNVAEAGIVITECGQDTPDFVEIQNVSSATRDTTGWRVAVSDGETDINAALSQTWNLPTSVAACEVLYRTDSTSENYWGRNIFWITGDRGWVMLLDDESRVVDFVAWGWTAPQIAAMHPVIDGHEVTIETQFTGSGVDAKGTGTIQRCGTSDQNNAADFKWHITASRGNQNDELSLPFSGGMLPAGVSPQQAGPLVGGSWSGSVQVFDASASMFLHAAAAGGHLGDSLSFEVLDVAPQGTPTSWLAAHGLTAGGPVIEEMGDADGDGMLNWEEYLAGTDPLDDASILGLASIARTGGNRLEFTFRSVPGKTYIVQSSGDIATGNWTDCPYSSSVDGSLRSTPIQATAETMTVFVPTTKKSRVFRIVLR